MNIGGLLKSLSISQLFKLSLIVLSKPILFYCFTQATRRCISISTMYFGDAHNKNNVANAFRHALWNMLIIAYCLKAGKTFKNSCNWAKYITDWHEKAFRNSELAEAMDLHNNAVGRAIMKEKFQHQKPSSTEKLVILLLKEVKKAKYIERINDLKSAEKSLVFIDYI